MTKLLVSGSTILSDPLRLAELFWDGTDGVEIGSLPSPSILRTFSLEVTDRGRI